MKNYLKIVKIDQDSPVPKYHQLAAAIQQGVEQEVIVNGDLLPSIHDFCVALDVSKNTVEKAYNKLKKEGLVASYKGKGFFIGNTDK
jgi:DNA-binding transcriptional regulator YhcF (GntR family)